MGVRVERVDEVCLAGVSPPAEPTHACLVAIPAP